MSGNVVFKDTTDLTVQEKQQFRALFLRVFGKKMNQKLFDRKFLYTPKGYSYHGLILDEGVIVGAFNAIPYRYKYFDKYLVFSLSVDTMIAPDHRGGGHLVKMADVVYEALVRDDVPFIFGFPNEYFYKHEKRILGTRGIGELDYYVTLRSIGTVMPELKLLNCLSRAFSWVAIGLSRVPKNAEDKYHIEKVVDEESDKHRYDECYGRITIGDGTVCIYRICEEENRIQTLYIIDVLPLTPTSMARAVKQVYRTAMDSIDIMIYVGAPHFRPAGLLKVPHSKKPQRIRMTGKILIPEVVDDSVFAIENWNVNMSNFDVR